MRVSCQEYSPDMHSISRKDKKPSSGSDGITLTSIVKNESNSEPVNATTRNSYSTTPEPTDSSKALIKYVFALVPCASNISYFHLILRNFLPCFPVNVVHYFASVVRGIVVCGWVLVVFVCL